MPDNQFQIRRERALAEQKRIREFVQLRDAKIQQEATIRRAWERLRDFEGNESGPSRLHGFVVTR